MSVGSCRACIIDVLQTEQGRQQSCLPCSVCRHFSFQEKAMNIKIGSAPDNWGVWFSSDPRQTPWNRFLDELVEAGYNATELGPFGYLPTDPAQLHQELRQRGITVTGTFAMADLANPAEWPELERQVLGAGALLASFCAKFLVLIDSLYSDQHTGQPLRPTRLDG